jgi:hypothetical protein
MLTKLTNKRFYLDPMLITQMWLFWYKEASLLRLQPMRPKARGLAPTRRPAWLARSDGPYRLPFRTVPVALTGAVQLRTDGISSCCYIDNVHNQPLYELRYARKACSGTLVGPCLLSAYNINKDHMKCTVYTVHLFTIHKQVCSSRT